MMPMKDLLLWIACGVLLVAGVVSAFLAFEGAILAFLLVMLALLGVIGATALANRGILHTVQKRQLETLAKQNRLRDTVHELNKIIRLMAKQVDRLEPRLSATQKFLREERSHLQQVSARQKQADTTTLAELNQLQAILKAIRRKLTSDATYTRTEIQAHQQVVTRLNPARLLPPLGGWALDARSAVELLDLLEERRPKTIVEFGSGSSTVLLADYARRHPGVTALSFDHLEEYAAITRKYLRNHGLEEFVTLHVTELVPQRFDDEEFRWYDLSHINLPEDIDLILIDGPPGNTGHHARFPAVPALINKLSEHALLVLDDGVRQEEQETADRWESTQPTVTRHSPDLTALIVLEHRSDSAGPDSESSSTGAEL